MTIEADIFNALKGLVASRCFRDFAPLATAKPYITYVQIGGEPVNFVDNAVASKKNGRFQLNVWGTERDATSALMLQIEAALIQSSVFQARPISAPASTYDHDMLIYGSMQDFTVWSNR